MKKTIIQFLRGVLFTLVSCSKKTVVENVQDSGKEVSLLDARLVDPNTAIDEKVPIKLDTKEFGRIAAQTARNIIRQGIKDGERSLMTVEFKKHLKKID